MYAIYGNIYHPCTPNVSIYTSTMDPMGVVTQFQTSSNHSPQSSELNGDGVDPCCAENSETSKCSRRIICSFFLYLNKHGENGFGSVPQFERSAKKCTTRHWYQQHTVPISSPRRSLTFPWWHPLFLLLYVHGDDLWPIEIHMSMVYRIIIHYPIKSHRSLYSHTISSLYSKLSLYFHSYVRLC